MGQTQLTDANGSDTTNDKNAYHGLTLLNRWLTRSFSCLRILITTRFHPVIAFRIDTSCACATAIASAFRMVRAYAQLAAHVSQVWRTAGSKKQESNLIRGEIIGRRNNQNAPAAAAKCESLVLRMFSQSMFECMSAESGSKPRSARRMSRQVGVGPRRMLPPVPQVDGASHASGSLSWTVNGNNGRLHCEYCPVEERAKWRVTKTPALYLSTRLMPHSHSPFLPCAVVEPTLTLTVSALRSSRTNTHTHRFCLAQ
jgi:hypothetical protein